jgi:beta-phosphoglucomutase
MAALKKAWDLAATNTNPNYHRASFSAIFDMDGTLIDNTPYHFKSWQMLYKKYGMGEISKETYYKDISGVPVLETIRRVFGEGDRKINCTPCSKKKKNFTGRLMPLSWLRSTAWKTS